MADIIISQSHIESVARFQSLQAGQYWTSRRAILAHGIEGKTTLLICSIRWADDILHTIILQSHPSKIGKSYKRKSIRDDGSEREEICGYFEHRFLLNDFLENFDFEPDYQAIRAKELQAVQNEISALQSELVQSQSNPSIMTAIVYAEMNKTNNECDGTDAAPANDTGTDVSVSSIYPATSSAGLVSLSSGSMADAIGLGLTVAGVEQLRLSANAEHKVATIKAEWIRGKTSEIAEKIGQMTPYYSEQAAAALAQTEDVRKYVDKLLLGIGSLDLYVGKDVEVITIREGISAPKSIPLTFVQKKLLMDEELAAWVDVDEMFDFTKVDLFYETLRANDSLVNQIFPTERCVLVMATTRRYIDYGNIYESAAKRKINCEVFMLVRDGTNIYRVESGVESHLGASRLFPSKDEHESIFAGINGSTIKFEDVAYTDRLASHERFALHYKRFLLLACGLDHRLKLFGDFYDGPTSFEFVSLNFQSQYCKFLHDDDGTGLIAGIKRLPVREWEAEKNSYLRSGSRVLCKWEELMNPSTAPGACKKYPDSGFDRRFSAKNDMDIVIAYKEGNSICVDIEVFSNRYRREDQSFMCKVNLTNFNGGWFNIETPYLCLDAVLPEEIDWYIHNRADRSNHIAYIRFYKNALRFIEAERASERDSRDRLLTALSDGAVATGAEAQKVVQQAVIAWRAANRGRDLPSFVDGVSPEEWPSLLDQMFMLAGEGMRQAERVAAYLREKGSEPLRLVMSGNANFIVYAAPTGMERDDRIEPHIWVHRIILSGTKKKVTEKSRRWVVMPEKAASETTILQWEEANNWVSKKSVFKNFAQKQAVFSKLNNFHKLIEPYRRSMSESEFLSQIDDWDQCRTNSKDGSIVPRPDVQFAFGLIYNKSQSTLSYLCVGSDDAHEKLRDLAPTDILRSRFKTAFIDMYKNKSASSSLFENANSNDAQWSLSSTSLSMCDSSYGVFTHLSLGLTRTYVRGYKYGNPLLSVWLKNAQAHCERDGSLIYLADGLYDEKGNFAPDEILGILLPDGFSPVDMVDVWVTSEGYGKYSRWFDIYPIDCDHAGSKPQTSGYQSHRSEKEFSSPEAARKHVMDSSANASKLAVMATTLPDAPQAPIGAERWYVI